MRGWVMLMGVGGMRELGGKVYVELGGKVFDE